MKMQYFATKMSHTEVQVLENTSQTKQIHIDTMRTITLLEERKEKEKGMSATK